MYTLEQKAENLKLEVASNKKIEVIYLNEEGDWTLTPTEGFTIEKSRSEILETATETQKNKTKKTNN